MDRTGGSWDEVSRRPGSHNRQRSAGAVEVTDRRRDRCSERSRGSCGARSCGLCAGPRQQGAGRRQGERRTWTQRLYGRERGTHCTALRGDIAPCTWPCLVALVRGQVLRPRSAPILAPAAR